MSNVHPTLPSTHFAFIPLCLHPTVPSSHCALCLVSAMPTDYLEGVPLCISLMVYYLPLISLLYAALSRRPCGTFDRLLLVSLVSWLIFRCYLLRSLQKVLMPNAHAAHSCDGCTLDPPTNDSYIFRGQLLRTLFQSNS